MSDLKTGAGEARLDTIETAAMEFTGFLGTTEAERAYPQPLFFDLQLHLDLSRAGRSDKIRDTVNYHRVQKLIGECVFESRHRLLEAIATDVLYREQRNPEKKGDVTASSASGNRQNDATASSRPETGKTMPRHRPRSPK